MTPSLRKTHAPAFGTAVSGLDGIAAAAGQWLVRSVDAVLDWQEQARQRNQLSELDDHMLHDIGLSRADVEFETNKPFWRS